MEIKIKINCNTCGVSQYCSTMVASTRLCNSIKQHMERTTKRVYEALRDLKQVSKEELCEALSLSKAEVSDALEQLSDKVKYSNGKYTLL